MKNDHDHNRNQRRNQNHRPQSKVRKYYLYIYFLWLLFIYHCYICAFTITIYISYMFSWLYIYIYFIYISFLYSIYFYYYLHIIDPKRRRRRGGFKRVFGMSLKRDRTTHYCLQHAIFNLHHPLLKQYTVKQINTFDILHHPFKPNSISNPYLDTNINEFNIAFKTGQTQVIQRYFRICSRQRWSRKSGSDSPIRQIHHYQIAYSVVYIQSSRPSLSELS